MTIEVTEEQGAALTLKAAAHGLSLKGWLAKLAGEDANTPRKLLKSGRGMLAKYGPAPSAEEIDENRREMVRNFPRDDF